jgi:hypothetical protein
LAAGKCCHVGFNGRWNKKADTCYCWWVGGALSVSSDLYVCGIMSRGSMRAQRGVHLTNSANS